jgi:hypothetical protein
MDGAPPPQSELEEALAAAAVAHHDFERAVLKGERDELWAGFYAAFLLGRFGEFAAAGRLAALLAEVDASDDWAAVAAEHVLRKLHN